MVIWAALETHNPPMDRASPPEDALQRQRFPRQFLVTAHHEFLGRQ